MGDGEHRIWGTGPTGRQPQGSLEGGTHACGSIGLPEIKEACHAAVSATRRVRRAVRKASVTTLTRYRDRRDALGTATAIGRDELRMKPV